METLYNMDRATYASVATAVSVLAVPFWWWYQHQKFKRTFGEATYRPAFAPLSLPGMLYGLGLQFCWDQRLTVYRKTSRELISMEPTVWGQPILYTNSSEVIRQISGGGTSPWQKPPWSQEANEYWGRNVLSVSGNEWRKHRKVLQPSFNPTLYEMVWKETSRFFNEMLVQDNWPMVPGESKSFPRAQVFTQRVALCVVLSCAFGLPIKWQEKTYAGDGFTLDDGVQFQSDNLLLVVYAPSWLFRLPFKRLQYVASATNAMRNWFNNAVTAKKAEIAKTLAETDGDLDSESLKRDIFSRLTLASQLDSKSHLKDSEIIGNTWVMYFAGHDTTANVLAAAFCLLAAHKEEQEIVLEEINRLVKEFADVKLDFEVYDSLVKTRSAFVEALRLYPAGSILIRETKEDTVLRVPCGTGANGEVIEEAVPIPKGTPIVGDMIGVQYNARAFPQPEVFRPSRWYGVTTEDAYTAFSGGPRACIGRRFALVEGVCFLANVLRHYQVEPLLEDGETVEAWKTRVLGKAEIKMTLSIADSPLVFRRR
ncbi:hypothetical protein M408DRAFT_321086 [Serendipita vermifera MAFF 305830]|uniref:Cytochrome P450 n=1 Tax=Serendipita vermifera MAFF 305830 TaxID=933852 RepID=A0A0C3AFE5_SERVB|nr:hypothetical protein M408DRAFT_321086 [Serendipita vermifera MAFF 305830]